MVYRTLVLGVLNGEVLIHTCSPTHTPHFGYILVGQEGGQNDDRGAAVPVLELGKKHGHTRRHTGNQLVLDLLAGCLEEVCTYV